MFLDSLDKLSSQLCTKKIDWPDDLKQFGDLYVRLMPNDIYRAFTEHEAAFAGSIASSTYWWVLLVCVTDETGKMVFADKLPSLGSSVPSLEEANKLKEHYAAPIYNKVMSHLWDEAMKYNGYISAKEAVEGKKPEKT